jgi:hypothetical protein
VVDYGVKSVALNLSQVDRERVNLISLHELLERSLGQNGRDCRAVGVVRSRRTFLRARDCQYVACLGRYQEDFGVHQKMEVS